MYLNAHLSSHVEKAVAKAEGIAATSRPFAQPADGPDQELIERANLRMHAVALRRAGLLLRRERYLPRKERHQGRDSFIGQSPKAPSPPRQFWRCCEPKRRKPPE